MKNTPLSYTAWREQAWKNRGAELEGACKADYLATRDKQAWRRYLQGFARRGYKFSPRFLNAADKQVPGICHELAHHAGGFDIFPAGYVFPGFRSK